MVGITVSAWKQIQLQSTGLTIVRLTAVSAIGSRTSDVVAEPSSPIVVDVLEGLCAVDGKDTEEALPCPHVLVPHGAVLLLTCSVQDVQQTCLPINHHLLPVRVLKEGERKRGMGWVRRGTLAVIR